MWQGATTFEDVLETYCNRMEMARDHYLEGHPLDSLNIMGELYGALRALHSRALHCGEESDEIARIDRAMRWTWTCRRVVRSAIVRSIDESDPSPWNPVSSPHALPGTFEEWSDFVMFWNRTHGTAPVHSGNLYRALELEPSIADLRALERALEAREGEQYGPFTIRRADDFTDHTRWKLERVDGADDDNEHVITLADCGISPRDLML